MTRYFLTYFLNNKMEIRDINKTYLPIAIDYVNKSLSGLLEIGCTDIHLCNENGVIIKKF